MRHALHFLLIGVILQSLIAIAGAATGLPESTPAVSASVASDDTAVTVGVVDGAPAVTSLLCRASGFEWVAGAVGATAGPLIDVAELAGKPIALRWKFVGMEADAPVGGGPAGDPATRTFRFACEDPASGLHLELDSTWSARPGPGPVEHRIVIRNRGREAVLLPAQASLALTVRPPAGHTLEQWWVEKGAGTPTAEGTHHKALGDGDESLVRCWPSGRDNPRDAIPWVSVQDIQGRRGWYAGVEMTARVEFAMKVLPDGSTGNSTEPIPAGAGRALRVRAGLMKDDKAPFFTRVLAGEQFDAPPVFIGCYRGDVDDGANRLRRWARAQIVPPARDERYPLLVNNSWGGGMAVDEPLARAMIDESADLGLEMFHIDAGWFRTVGDWRADPKKFPHGLGPIADYAHQKKLKFGLWVGWTQGGDQVDPSGGHQILSVHDPAMAPWFCQRLPATWKANEFSGATVCLAEPAATDWCLGSLRSIIRDAKLDMLEHDQTMVTDGCEQADHLHTRSRVDAGYRAAQGYYRVYDTLRAENPDLLFENCVNGGHMIDYGALRRCHYISITDTYDPLSNRRAFYDAAYALPPATCECYVEHAADLAARGLPQFRFMLRSGMMGWCTIMTDTRKWTPQQHDAARREFALYKSRLRPLIRSADLYHVSDRPDGVRWDGIQYFDPHDRRGVLFAFRGTGDEPEHSFALKGVDAGAKYALSFQDGSEPPRVVSGQELIGPGLRVKLPERESSEIVHIEQQ